jgi:hypothetical protein
MLRLGLAHLLVLPPVPLPAFELVRVTDAARAGRLAAAAGRRDGRQTSQTRDDYPSRADAKRRGEQTETGIQIGGGLARIRSTTVVGTVTRERATMKNLVSRSPGSQHTTQTASSELMRPFVRLPVPLSSSSPAGCPTARPLPARSLAHWLAAGRTEIRSCGGRASHERPTRDGEAQRESNQRRRQRLTRRCRQTHPTAPGMLARAAAGFASRSGREGAVSHSDAMLQRGQHLMQIAADLQIIPIITNKKTSADREERP